MNKMNIVFLLAGILALALALSFLSKAFPPKSVVPEVPTSTINTFAGPAVLLALQKRCHIEIAWRIARLRAGLSEQVSTEQMDAFDAEVVQYIATFGVEFPDAKQVEAAKLMASLRTP